jgi:hypothetical protein
MDVPVQPILLSDVELTLGDDNYEAHVDSVLFEPAAQIVKWKGMTPAAQFNFATIADWIGKLSFAQDWATAASLSQFLYDNEGKPITATFKPKKAEGVGTVPTWTVTIIATPGRIGGDGDTVATATVTVACQGKPLKTLS